MSKEISSHHVVRLDFSGRDAIRERDRREADADASLDADPEFRSLRDRVADSEETAAREHRRTGNKLILAGLAIAGATVAVDFGLAEVFDMPQLLLGDDIKQWPVGIMHGVVLAAGGVASAVFGFRGAIEWGEADALYRSAAHSNRGF